MKEYSYCDIKRITSTGILFGDGFELLFEECRNEWCAEKRISGEQSYCVAERDSFAKIPYFLFYSKKRVKILFNKRVLELGKETKTTFMTYR